MERIISISNSLKQIKLEKKRVYIYRLIKMYVTKLKRVDI